MAKCVGRLFAIHLHNGPVSYKEQESDEILRRLGSLSNSSGSDATLRRGTGPTLALSVPSMASMRSWLLNILTIWDGIMPHTAGINSKLSRSFN